MITALLERFGGYTYSSLMAEDAEFFQVLQLEALGRGGEQ